MPDKQEAVIGEGLNQNNPKRSADRTFISSFVSKVDNQPWSNPLILAMMIGILALIVFGFNRDNPMSAIAIAILIAGCALAVGAIFGFLFGIPRTVQETAPREKILGGFESSYQVNTNLEQISDWLTKIIVGIGLVQAKKISELFITFSAYLSESFGQPSVPPAISAVILIYFGSIGFLTFYLWTRIYLTQEFTRADRAARNSPEFYEGLIQALLYQPPPDGFESANEAGEEFLRTFGEGNWRVWRSLACGYAQKYSYLQNSDKQDGDELKSIRTRALNAVRHVLQLNPEEKSSLRGLWDPATATPQEDDLTVFFNDQDFKNLLQEDPKKTS